MESDRLAPEEFIILIFLGLANIFFSLIFRPETLSSSLFALIVGTSMIYLLLIIFERDKYSKMRHDHALICTNLISYVQSKVLQLSLKPEVSTIENEIKTTIKKKTITRGSQSSAYWVFCVFTFLFAGFSYAFLYASLQQTRSVETSPLNSTYTKKTIEINIALLDWPSAQLKGQILAEIINQHTDYNASLIPSSNELAFQEMDEDNGMIDIHPDLWVENNHTLIRRYVKAFGTVALGKQLTFALRDFVILIMSKIKRPSFQYPTFLHKR